ncbi:Protein of unknown function (DUF1676) [Nesidiocoris tenuis]|uniref:Osiris 10 n=1 Tax=Nesidiocoris tenuis TaxID=355587 RepID=A0ABN7AYG0_9HEMI|nr:Protein of unknown function (DUF1676) [Nesidiocoris tenuis]
MVSRCRWVAFALYALLAICASVRAEEIVEDPNAAVEGIYSECVMGMSWACLQRKALLFIDRMGKSEKFPLVGDGVISLVRTAPPEPEISEDSLRGLDSNSLGDLVDNSIFKFFQTHVFRFEVPSWLKISDEQERSDNAIDFYIGDNVEEGRKKGGLGGGGGGGGKKGMKKMMMMMCMMAAGKMMMLGPLMMGMTKLLAMKALIMAAISLTISKIMILKKLKMKQSSSSSGWSSGGGGGGGGWSSGGGGSSGGWSSGGGGGGGGGWDRSFPAHDLAYRGHIDDNSA